MTIRSTIAVAAANTALSNLEACCENAPEGTYEDAKELRSILGETCDTFMARLRELGLKTPNCDQIREVEAVLYNYVREANPERYASAEGFGTSMDGPARERVIAAASRDRDFLLGIGNVGVDEPTVDELLDRAEQRSMSQ